MPVLVATSARSPHLAAESDPVNPGSDTCRLRIDDVRRYDTVDGMLPLVADVVTELDVADAELGVELAK